MIFFSFVAAACYLTTAHLWTHRVRAREKKLANHNIISNGKDVVYVLMIAKRMNEKKNVIIIIIMNKMWLWFTLNFTKYFTGRGIRIFLPTTIIISSCLPILLIKCLCVTIFFYYYYW